MEGAGGTFPTIGNGDGNRVRDARRASAAAWRSVDAGRCDRQRRARRGAEFREQPGPILVFRYNMYPAAAVVGGTRPGYSTGQGIEAMERLADASLPETMAYEWTEINFIQTDAAKNIWNNLIFPLAVVFVFLVLAAQYESWALPLAVILVVPMCILGSLTGV